ncbi:MAG: hypothetical protein EXR64_02075 [Dehalococcoidia bacterium]|nr:hypothetical protein [Dehalococcoidia bacterium]
MSGTPRRRLTRRSLPPRPTYEGAPGVAAAPTTAPRQNAETRRLSENVLRQAPYLGAELRRIAGVITVCLGMLAALTIIDRMR